MDDVSEAGLPNELAYDSATFAESDGFLPKLRTELSATLVVSENARSKINSVTILSVTLKVSEAGLSVPRLGKSINPISSIESVTSVVIALAKDSVIVTFCT